VAPKSGPVQDRAVEEVHLQEPFLMTRHLETTIATYPIAGVFTISRGSRTQADVVVCSISERGATGRGECVPYKRYGETLESVEAQINATRAFIIEGGSRHELLTRMKPGAARNAIDCALWDLEAKLAGVPVARAIGVEPAKPLTTAYTLSLGDADAMADQARQQSSRPLLKVKLGTDDDVSRMRAIREAAPDSKLIVDANEGWTADNLERHLAVAAECRVHLIEQPLPAGDDAALGLVKRQVPICADESVHATSDLAQLLARYDAVNIKLDKSGGLTEALAMKREAERLGFSIMVGCMVGSSLAMAPAVLLAQGVDYVDVDGPLLLARDCDNPLRYDLSLVYPPARELWG
jgi:L-alanine-DL-glutamate epimerase-like enolase superfamily enzyme